MVEVSRADDRSDTLKAIGSNWIDDSLECDTDVFSIVDKRLLCGSALPYELTAYKKAVSFCSNLSVQPVAVAVPDEMKDYCKGLFGTELLFADCSHTLFDEKKNEALYKEVVKEYTK